MQHPSAPAGSGIPGAEGKRYQSLFPSQVVCIETEAVSGSLLLFVCFYTPSLIFALINSSCRCWECFLRCA